MKKILKTATVAVSLLTTTNSLIAQDTKVFECEGKKLIAEGKKIVSYKDAPNKGLDAFVLIRQDSIIYTSIKTNVDESLYMIQKFHFYIGDILFTDAMVQRAFYPKKVGEKTISVVTFYAFGNQQLNWYEEMLCHLKKFGLYKKQGLEMFFDNDADAKEFFAKAKAIHASLPPKTTANSTTTTTDKKSEESKTYNYISVFNDTGSDMYVKKEGDPQSHHIAPNASFSFTCKLGEKFSWCEKNSSNPKGYLFSVTDQMIKDKTIKLSTGTKK
ncbi:MAG: hypothetical protein IPJ32_05690 [Sphingobacteriaceae bacterium]|nr:hypothetical protein [Sphingobacteriaceae bacterium]